MARHCAIICLLAAATSAARAADADGPEQADRALRVMTFNIRYANPLDGANAWPHRRDWVAEIVREQETDILGCQEVLKSQHDDLRERLPDYESYGPGRDDGKERGEAVPIFYRKDRFEVLERSAFWLSETPEVAGSRSWDSSLPRVTTYLRLKDKRSGRTLSVFNMHFDHLGAKARLESARILLERQSKCPEGDFVVLTGDFNCRPDSAPYRRLTEGNEALAETGRVRLHDSRTAAGDEHEGPDSTWNGFREIVPGSRIDFVFVRDPGGVRRHRVLDERRDGRFPSDHLPVVVDLELPE